MSAAQHTPAGGATDDYKAWYEEAMVASNEAGCACMSAAETIRYLDSQLTALTTAARAAEPEPLQMVVYKEPYTGPIYTPDKGQVCLWPDQYRELVLRWHRRGWDDAVQSLSGSAS